MSNAQNETEQVMRDLHILIAQGETYDKAKNKIIIDKKEAQELLGKLKKCFYDLQDEYELTEQSKSRAERDFKRRTDAIVEDASSKAEDVYAGSVLYTDEALHRAMDILQEATESIDDICRSVKSDLNRERDTLQRDRTELKSNLSDLKDTDKYLRLIEESNRRIAKEKERSKEKGADAAEANQYKAIKPEIKINKEYFRRAGIPIEEDAAEEKTAGASDKKQAGDVNESRIPEGEIIAEEITSQDWDAVEADEKKESVKADIRVNLDAEYFKWKQAQEN